MTYFGSPSEPLNNLEIPQLDHRLSCICLKSKGISQQARSKTAKPLSKYASKAGTPNRAPAEAPKRTPAGKAGATNRTSDGEAGAPAEVPNRTSADKAGTPEHASAEAPALAKIGP